MLTSIIIPTYNRAALLEKTLTALTKQSLGEEDFEVVIIDDGSTDGTKEILQHSNFPLNIEYCFQPNNGDALARNKGAMIAKCEFLIFIDDDIILDQDYVVELIKEHNKQPKRIVIGSCYMRVENPTSGFHRYITELDFFPLAEPTFDQVCSHNMGISKKDFWSLGGMKKMVSQGNDTWCDLEFAFRAENNGFEFRRNQKARCFHYDQHLYSFESYLKRIERTASQAFQLFETYPELRNEIPMFKDKTPIDFDSDSPKLVGKKILRKFLSNRYAINILDRIIALSERQFSYTKFLEYCINLRIGASIYSGYRSNQGA